MDVAARTRPGPDARIAPLEVRHVLVPLDGSDDALRALPTAQAMAEGLDAELHTIDIGPQARDARPGKGPHAARRRDLGRDGALAVAGDGPLDVIARVADGLGDCAVCMTSRSSGRLGGALFGSVALDVANRLPHPLVALGPLVDRPAWSPRPPSWPAPLAARRIVACVDGSTASEQVLPVSAGWARALGMALSILTVVEESPAPLRPHRSRDGYGPSGDPDRYLDELVQRWAADVPDVDGEVVRHPLGTARGVQDHLEVRPAGLVVVGARAQSRARRLFRGSAAWRIVQQSTAPCLVTMLDPSL